MRFSKEHAGSVALSPRGNANDKLATGVVRATMDHASMHGGNVARGDVADFVVRQFMDYNGLQSNHAYNGIASDNSRAQQSRACRAVGFVPGTVGYRLMRRG